MKLTGNLLLTVCALLSGCSAPSEPATDSPANPAQPDLLVVVPAAALPEFDEASQFVQQQALQTSQQLLSDCQLLHETVGRFLDQLDTASQARAQQSWRDCYRAWNQFLLYQQQPFSLADSDHFRALRRLINTRPFQPGYIDGLPDYPFSGLVHETGLALSMSLLLEQHQMMDLESPALGFPVIETLLWREPLADYWAIEADDPEKPATRRAAYLSLATTALLDHLGAATRRWQPGDPAGFQSLPDHSQVVWFWQSALRLISLDVHQSLLAEAAPSEPDRYHPSLISGQGREALLARLSGLSLILSDFEEAAPNPLATWLSRAQLTVSRQQLLDELAATEQAVLRLPANYPFDSTADDSFSEARAALMALEESFHQINADITVNR